MKDTLVSGSILISLTIISLFVFPLNTISIQEEAHGYCATPTTFYDHGNYTVEEQMLLELINRARKDPEAEGLRLGIDLQEGITENLTSKPPLAMNKILCQTADEYSKTMDDYHELGHMVDGTSFSDRIVTNGYTGTAVAESVAALFLLSWLYPALMGSLGDRMFIVGIPYFSTEVGIGNYQGGYTDIIYCISGTAYLLGVVYNDTNGNSFYDVGEGLENITLMPGNGTYYTQTGPAGGYAVPISVTGNSSITASGGDLLFPITKYVNTTVGGDNIKVDFLANESIPITTTPIQSTTDTTLPSQTSTTASDSTPITSETEQETTTLSTIDQSTTTPTEDTTNFISLMLIIWTFVIILSLRRKSK